MKGRAEDAVEWRRELHRHPETCYEEEYASNFVAEKLEGMGIEVHRGLAGTGVVGVIEGKGGGNRAVGLRADMDGLDIEEKSGVAWCSENEGKMHGCGHDGHMAMLLCAAGYLSSSRNFSGRCYVIFQPAEEGGAGARRMMEEGLFEKFPMESVWGLHNLPGKPVGWVGVKEGALMAATDIFEMRVKGLGGHAAMPHQVRDPVVAASHLVVGLQSIVSRGLDPLDSGVVSVTKVHGGEAFNVIPDEVVCGGTVRTLSKEGFLRVREDIERVRGGIAKAFGVEIEMDYRRSYPVLVNTGAETLVAEEVARDLLGEENVERTVPMMGGEDFAFMLEEKPGSYIFLGGGEGRACLHSAEYDFNDEILELGASYWVKLTERLLPLGE